jgi:small-conductance mechanosensitive channel
MQTPPTNRHSQKPSNPYSPSVPISVYKELAAELQEAREMVQSLKSQNQQLVKQNQQLRQQVEKVVQSAQHLQQIVASFGSVSEAEVPRPQPTMPPEPRSVPPSPPPPSPPPRAASIPEEFAPPPHNPEPVPPPYTETLVIEQEDSRSHRSPSSEGLSDVSGWMLLVAILLIVLTAFGTGFLIVRPLLNNNNKR